jgi:beta-glucosidase
VPHLPSSSSNRAAHRGFDHFNDLDDPQTRQHGKAATTLLAHLTFEEKISLLHQFAPPIERLGLAAFHTGTEALHGVAWLGTATTYPQPVGLAAAWDQELLTRIGDAVATEVRAQHAKDPRVSLNVWAPVVNSLRHPLWGRNEEGYSEDPLLTGDCAIAYARGLTGRSGNGSAFWKTVPTLKHFLAYNNEVDRAVTSSDMRARVLHEYEFPAFSRPLAEGVIGAVMPSYNLVNGRPNHVARDLLDTLRSWSTAPIAVVSDAAAPTNVVNLERYYPDAPASHAAMLEAGIDSFTDNDANAAPTLEAVRAALDSGILDLRHVDQAVFRMLYLRSLTGEFVDNQHVAHHYQGVDDPYAGIATSAIDLPESRALAREAAAKSLVLLKNNGVFPLSDTTRVAVVGPMATATLHDWYSGTPPYLSTIGEAFTGRYGKEQVIVDSGADRVAIYSPSSGRYLRVQDDGTLTASAQNGAQAETFELTDWGHGVTTLRAQSTGRLLQGGWIVSATADRVGGWVAQETFALHTHGDATVSLLHIGSGKWLRTQTGSQLVSGDSSDLAYAERFEIDLLSSGIERVIAAAQQADVTIAAVGNDPHILGRETEDRPDLALPRSARALWRTVRAHSATAALTIVSSYPYALGSIADESDALEWSSHAGQEQGRGIVDVLSGDVEPQGRLAQEWVHDETCVPHILDYDIVSSSGTYWYNECEPDFEFGHGLSYTSVEYSALTLNEGAAETIPETTHHAAPVHASVTVRNTGERVAHEVVALYAALDFAAYPLGSPAPLRRLAGYTRVTLQPGQERTVTVPLFREAFEVWDVRGERLQVHPGTYRVWAGTSRRSLVEALWEVDSSLEYAPSPLLGVALRMDQFDAHHHIVHRDADRTGANCVAVAAGHSSGYVEFTNVDARSVKSISVDLARDVLGQVGDVSVSLHGAGDGSTVGAAHILGQVSGTAASVASDKYSWTETTLPVDRAALETALVREPLSTLRVTLHGNIRVRSITFS